MGFVNSFVRAKITEKQNQTVSFREIIADEK